ncbi:hypothetical protein BIW11_07954 [Tropilaelaps mercedesae]|uniref:Uncharacterized protein n=1 Tax=Tropilaelaps mercedesae TaxID=418985 RepID=A0A1V9XRP0_9ACAR|nr:hypothetical protein BIW11_07954 [Tropilaelaps mercedesae]
MQRSCSSRGTRSGHSSSGQSASAIGAGSQSFRGTATTSSSNRKGQPLYQQPQSFPFPQPHNTPVTGSASCNNVIFSPSATAPGVTTAANNTLTSTSSNATSVLLQQASTKLLGGGGNAGMMAGSEQVPSGNITGSGSSSGRRQRYSIDYTTLTEMDRMRAMQQVN